MKRIISLLLILVATRGLAQYRITENKQHAFPNDIPAGNYSGITWLGDNRYAVVNDKAEEDGFHLFEIDVDSVSGEIISAKNMGFRSSGFPNRDNEGIAYNRADSTILISGETDNRILEYDLNGVRTLREATLPSFYKQLPHNEGLEALSYNNHTQTLWTCNETDSILILSFDSLYRPLKAYNYRLEQPEADRLKAKFYAHGVGTICALDDGSLLLLERELYTPKSKLGAFVKCKMYHFVPDTAVKQKLAEWRTRLSLFGRSFANYEGMCLGPTLSDGSRVIILVADSQNQYAGVLKDWLKSLKLEIEQPSEL
ncbi:MAG: esterase-like activity of phytase family protein [Prevotella sp.]|jgi:uncharacterized protein YjiK